MNLNKKITLWGDNKETIADFIETLELNHEIIFTIDDIDYYTTKITDKVVGICDQNSSEDTIFSSFTEMVEKFVLPNGKTLYEALTEPKHTTK